MEPDKFRKAIDECPLLVRMNDGREVVIEKPDFVIVGDYTAGVLVREKGKLLNMVISLLNIASIVPHYQPS